MIKQDKNRPLSLRALAAALCVLATILVCLGGLPGLAQDENAPSPEPSPEPAAAAGNVRVVYTPLGTGAETLEKFAPFTKKVGEALGRSVEAICNDSFEKIYKIYEAGDFDIAYMTPLPFVEISKRAKLDVLAMELYTVDANGYRSLIIARPQQASNHEGIVLAFTNKHSTSGYMVPQLYFLTEINKPAEEFADKVVFAGDHKTVIKGVYNGDYDIGATNNVDLDLLVKEGEVPKDSFSVIWQSDLIPGSPVCVNPNMDQATRTKLLEGVISLNQDQAALDQIGIKGYKQATRKDYDIMFKLKEVLAQ